MKIQRPLLIVPILVILCLVACNSSMQTIVPTPFQTPTVTPTQTVEASPTKSPTNTATPVVEPLAGVVYQLHNQTTNQTSLSQIGENGVAHVILQGYNIKFSPDQKQAIYQSYDQKTYTQCTFFTDFVKKEGKMLVCRSGGFFNQILGWAANDTGKIYGIFPTRAGIVGTISLSDGAMHPIDFEHLINADDAKLSPDGQSIAYSSYDSKMRYRIGWLYSRKSGVVALSSKNYKTGAYPDISKPAWSPDNQKIAWVLQDNHLHGAIGVFDLTKETAIVLHPSFNLVASTLDGGAPPISPSPMWSPDGQWISADQWVIGADGQKEYRFDGNIIGWSPDSQWVLYIVRDKSQSSISELRAAHFDNTQTFKLGVVKPYNNYTVLWSQDGQQFLFVDNDQKVQLVDTQTWKSHDMTSLFQFDAKLATISLLDWVHPISGALESMTILPTYTPESAFQCLNAPATRLKVGDHGRITFLDGSTTLLRPGPETGEHMLVNLAEGTEFDVVDGPVCYPGPERSDAYIYWKVMVPSVNKTGWLAEGDLNSYYLQPWP